jgi:transposase
MKKGRRKYSLEFKQEAVDLVRRTDKSLNQIAQELGIAQASLSRWIRQAQSNPGDGDIFARQEELKQLRKEVERLKMEQDILKKATAFFVKESQ